MHPLPEKPPHTRWTDEQWEAIVRRGENLLVSAAAGSGKTAVLVERIIRIISDPVRPVDVDRLLVATFTNAAAAEMKQRIRLALEQKLEDEPHSSHLRRQLALIHRALITTIHSFCLDVVRRHARVLGLDPAFRVASETEAELLRRDALEETFEHFYAHAEEDHPFWTLVEAYGGDRSDESLFRLVLKVYDFSRSHPLPDQWLNEQTAAFEDRLPSHWNRWISSLLHHAYIMLEGACEQLKMALMLARSPGGPAPYEPQLVTELKAVQLAKQWAAERNWEKLREHLNAPLFGRLSPCRGDEYDEQKQERAKQLRDEAKKRWAKLREELFVRNTDEYQSELERIAPVVRALTELVQEFASRYERAKRARSLVDFADLEHGCLRILADEQSQPGRWIPSPVALEYRRMFEEVLLDEYQDTNLVQEAIIELVSRDQPGNRFMVGDVKQSIYRFRLAEPGLFLDKYRAYREGKAGRRIDLSRNFRSREQIIAGVNFLFRQIMNETVAELTYDSAAELVHGAAYPPLPPDDVALELHLIEQDALDSEEQVEGAGDAGRDVEMAASANGEEAEEPTELEAARLEARRIAARIRAWMGLDGGKPLHVYDAEQGGMRPLEYRDIVILLRATSGWAPIIEEELARLGVPCYAELDSGYFTAGEIEMMMALLQIIDNPYQDIPLAAVLRSPIVQLNAEQLAQIRMAEPDGFYYDAVLRYAALEVGANPQLQNRLNSFLSMLERWREWARQRPVSELIQRIYRDTGLFEIVGGLPGGSKRQANLKALYDRARQYEESAFRGLFRFLRFMERMRESGSDPGSASALGEQENVVRLMSIHKSKGLEFPVVIVAGLGKKFNRQDLNHPFLMHRELGFGPKMVDTQLRVSYPTLPHLAIQRQLRLELMAEEMRVLYVALTRAKERLMLIGTVRRLDKLAETWAEPLWASERLLPAHLLTQADCFLDWIGPSLIRHPDAKPLRERAGVSANAIPETFRAESSRWLIHTITPALDAWAEAAVALESSPEPEMMTALREGDPLPGYKPSPLADEAVRRLDWTYPFYADTIVFSKTSVSEWRRLEEAIALDEPASHSLFDDTVFHKLPLRRPRFMEAKKMTPAERGVIYHTVMQHLPLEGEWSIERIHDELKRLVQAGLLTQDQLDAVNGEEILAFFRSELGRRLLDARHVWREMPFSYGVRAGEIYPQARHSEEIVLMQGVIDCMFECDNGLVLIDYKTDAVYAPDRLDEIRQRYRLQIGLYARAVSDIWKKDVKEAYLYLFDGGHVMEMETF